MNEKKKRKPKSNSIDSRHVCSSLKISPRIVPMELYQKRAAKKLLLKKTGVQR